MPLTPIDLGRRSNRARDVAAGCARFVNCYVEDIGQDGKVPYPVFACDGLAAFSTLSGGGKANGMLNLDNSLLWLHANDALWSVTTGGVATSRGAMTSSAHVYFARNRATTPDVVAVSADGVTRTISGTTVSTPSYHVDVGASLFNSVCQVDGYFVFTKSNGEFYISGIDATTIDPLDFANAQHNADGLLRGMVRGRDLMLCGSRSIEWWQNTGLADFPFQRATVQNFGTYAAPAMSNVFMGGEVGDTIIWPATGSDGGYVGVMLLQGYGAQKISTTEVDRAIEAATAANLRSYTYSTQGQTFYAVTDGATFTYEFNAKTGLWHERRGNGLAFAQCADAVEFAGGVVLADYASGTLYSLSDSQTPSAASAVEVRVSRDNGTTWTTARSKSIGTSSARSARTKFNRFGQSKEDGFQVELTLTNAIVEAGANVSATVVLPAVHATPYPVVINTLYVDAIPGVSGTANVKGFLGVSADIDRVRA
jgi:hypothetical protein